MNELRAEIEEARVRVAHYRGKAERPESRLEDEFALEKARNRLLTLELRLVKLGQGLQVKVQKLKQSQPQGTGLQGRRNPTRPAAVEYARTKRKQISASAREKAEADFAALQTKELGNKTVTGEQGGS
ncbi:hypothetical protein LP7551_01735 [Roseibium album]|nr:hypothetical protein LP7551_01735 [Roseibium album]